MTIQEANNLILRPSMDLQCGLEEASTDTTIDSFTGIKTEYMANAGIDTIDDFVRVMELCNGGFLNDGKSYPIQEEELPSGKYGIISRQPADENGDYDTPIKFDSSSSAPAEQISLLVADHDGNYDTIYIEPEWVDGEATITVDSFKPNESLHILRVVNGQAWKFEKEDIVSCNLTLRAVDTSLNPELQISEIELKVYEPNDVTNLIGGMTEGAPIWYRAGYQDDMTQLRRFYVSQKLEWQDKVLTIKGQDATMFLEGELEGFWADDYSPVYKASMLEHYFDYIFPKHSNNTIEVETIGEPPYGTLSEEINLFIDKASKRKNIANAVNLFNGDVYYNYVDAGRPTVYYEKGVNEWDIFSDQIGDYVKKVEFVTNKVEAEEYQSSLGEQEELTQFDVGYVGALYTYYSSEPIADWAIGGNVFDYPIRYAQYTPYSISFTSTGTGTAIIYGRKISKAVTNLSYELNTKGVTTAVESMPLLLLDDVNVTEQATEQLLERSNIIHEFVYRGDPRMQPRDIIHLNTNRNDPNYVFSNQPQSPIDVNINFICDGDEYIRFEATPDMVGYWKDDGTMLIAGAYDEILEKWEWLYDKIMLTEEPSEEFEAWLKVNGKQASVIDTTIESLTLEHANGGLISRIVARKEVV